MAGFMFGADTDPLDVERYFRALRRAQMELDLEPEPYRHYYLKETPERCHDQIDIRCFGPDERVVFLPYTALGLEPRTSGQTPDFAGPGVRFRP